MIYSYNYTAFHGKHWTTNTSRGKRRRQRQRKTLQAHSIDVPNNPPSNPIRETDSRILSYFATHKDFIRKETGKPTFRTFVPDNCPSFKHFVLVDMFRPDLRPYLVWNVRQLRYILRVIQKAHNLRGTGDIYEPSAKECAAAHQLMGYNSPIIPYGYYDLRTVTELTEVYHTARSISKTFNQHLRRHLQRHALIPLPKNQQNRSDS